MCIRDQYEMIEDLDAHERPRGSEAPRQRNVLRRRLRIARRVVVEEDEGGGARDHRLLEDLARMNQRRRQAADGDDGLALEAVTHVEGPVSYTHLRAHETPEH